ncbi:D-inositol-3-phosphate glycosyltransferase [uncultured archaeon]|nr:D-inositol-3-phosphate glycosyltransferase [uncultured archaeon]
MRGMREVVGGRVGGGGTVLFLCHAFPRFRDDGVAPFVGTLAGALRASGFNVDVVAPHARGLRVSEDIGGVTVHRFRYAPEEWETLAYRGVMHDVLIKNPLYLPLFASFFASYVLEAVKVSRDKKVNLIHAHWWIPGGVAAAVASKITGKPYVITCHGSDVFLVRKWKWLAPIMRWTLSNASSVTVVSSYIKDELSKQGFLGAKVIPMPVEERLLPKKRKDKRGAYRIVASGRLVERKGFTYLLDALDALAKKRVNFEAEIIGDGPLRDSLVGYAKERNLNVSFTGAMPHSEAIKRLACADIVVMPSITDWKGEAEGLGMVLAESQMMGIPVVGSSSGGILDVVEDGVSGLLVPEKDSKALAAALFRLIADNKFAGKIAEGGRKSAVCRFSLEGVAKKFIDVYGKGGLN